MNYKKLILASVMCLALSMALYSIKNVVGAEIKGPDDLKGANNVPNSPYFTKLDYYNMESKGGLTILPRFGTLQQKTEYSCGPAAALMVVKYLDKDSKATEEELCKAMQTSTVVGTNTKGMVRYFDKNKWDVESSLNAKTPSTDVEFRTFVLEHLRNNRPIIVENVDWGGHWRVIIGYDDMNTPENIGDDVLILADPYDTTDHAQDGYNVAPAQRFFYMWFDAKLFRSGEKDKQWLSVKLK